MRNPPETISPETFYNSNLGKTVNTSKAMSSEVVPQRPEHKSPEKMLSYMGGHLSKSCDPKKCVSD